MKIRSIYKFYTHALEILKYKDKEDTNGFMQVAVSEVIDYSLHLLLLLGIQVLCNEQWVHN